MTQDEPNQPASDSAGVAEHGHIAGLLVALLIIVALGLLFTLPMPAVDRAVRAGQERGGAIASSGAAWLTAVIANAKQQAGGRAVPGTPTPPAYQTSTYIIPAASGDVVRLAIPVAPSTFQGYFTVTGDGPDITFSLRGPSGAYLLAPARGVDRYAFNLTLPDAGIYMLGFDNSTQTNTARRITIYWREYPTASATSTTTSP